MDISWDKQETACIHMDTTEDWILKNGDRTAHGEYIEISSAKNVAISVFEMDDLQDLPSGYD